MMRSSVNFSVDQQLLIAKIHRHMASLPPGSVWLGDMEIETAIDKDFDGLPSACIERLVVKSKREDGKVKEDYRKPGYDKDKKNGNNGGKKP